MVKELNNRTIPRLCEYKEKFCEKDVFLGSSLRSEVFLSQTIGVLQSAKHFFLVFIRCIKCQETSFISGLLFPIIRNSIVIFLHILYYTIITFNLFLISKNSSNISKAV